MAEGCRSCHHGCPWRRTTHRRRDHEDVEGHLGSRCGAPVTLVYSYQRGPAVHVDGRSGIVVQRVVKGAIPPQAIPDGADPELELGFPVSVSHTAGTFHGGPAVHTLVGNIDWYPELEILVTGLATGPLYAWNHDGSAVSGWPFSALSGASYPVLGQFSRLATSSGAIGRLEVFSGHIGFPGKMAAIFGSGFMLLGWPQNSANFVSNPAAAADVNRDGVEEVFLNEEDGKLHGYRANGTILPGWPVHQGLGSQRWSTPAVADLDGAGDLEAHHRYQSGRRRASASLLFHWRPHVRVPARHTEPLRRHLSSRR